MIDHEDGRVRDDVLRRTLAYYEGMLGAERGPGTIAALARA